MYFRLQGLYRADQDRRLPGRDHSPAGWLLICPFTHVFLAAHALGLHV
ncbi:uncharacterized protein CLUP02_01006 [Colletotrichum lupini]|uniref:Uncharacterized protein n=2 Tax=Colletotrichum acutatum species complex TaxID=2707335 RepID=A0A9Q8SC61_9PEZI|nr:uncharacterized protein CLUP02_01006 [Colletotrichum lupini]XP_060317260.1 uncharacterized protein CCOS01_02808 [Colletotrichum costaricense]KAK1534056.1 hypothetical protein CCOS01_02808 [Colletotrichum costaricense]UQC74358.1 hypothetical protein CLUP02_01006 [Colletotrichum lupini]